MEFGVSVEKLWRQLGFTDNLLLLVTGTFSFNGITQGVISNLTLLRVCVLKCLKVQIKN